jgi:hypothetical protein
LRRDVFDRLYQYKSGHRLPTWEQALESLLPPDETESHAAGKRSSVVAPLADDCGSAAGEMP